MTICSCVPPHVSHDACRPFIMGTHFFSPANVMKLLENVRAAETSDLTVGAYLVLGVIIVIVM